MNFNLLLIIVLVVLVGCMLDGYKKGMIRELISFVSLIFLCIVVVLLGNALNSYFDGAIINVIIMILMLGVVGIVRHLLGIVFFSAKLISKLPVVSWLDKLLGIVFGILETIIMVWTMYTFVMLMDFGILGQQILDYTEQSRLLTWLFQNNYLASLLEQISSQISFLPL